MFENNIIFQEVSEDSSTKNGQETYAGATKLQTNRRNNYTDIAKTQSKRMANLF